jgi:hypothetical protein
MQLFARAFAAVTLLVREDLDQVVVGLGIGPALGA